MVQWVKGATMIIDSEAKKHLVAELAKLRTDLDAIDAYFAQQIANQDNNIKDLEIWIDAAEEPAVIPDPPPPTPEPEPEPEPEGRLVFSWDFKNGIPDESQHLWFTQQNNGTAAVVNDPVIPGVKVCALTIAKKTMNSNAAYLFFKRAIMPDFSVTRFKVYVPKPGVQSWQWFNIWQAKVATTSGGNTFAKWNFGILPGKMVVGYEPEKSSAGRTYIDLEFPYGRWVQVEVEYLKHLTRGTVAVSLDGVEIFRCEDKPTIEAARPDISASIMNYSADYYSTLYVKDVELWTM